MDRTLKFDRSDWKAFEQHLIVVLFIFCNLARSGVKGLNKAASSKSLGKHYFETQSQMSLGCNFYVYVVHFV